MFSASGKSMSQRGQVGFVTAMTFDVFSDREQPIPPPETPQLVDFGYSDW